MLINLRNGMMGGKRMPTAKDYVQDGLVAMWDGIENAGWGTHDANTVAWANLVQDKWHLAYNFNSARIEDNALFIIGGGYGAADISVGPPPDIWSLRTIEAVFKWDKVRRYNAHFIFSANPYPGEVNTIAGSIGKGFFWEENSKIVADIRNEGGHHNSAGIKANQYIANTIATVSADFGASFSEGISRITLNGSNAGATTGASRVDRGYFRIGGATETDYSLDNGAVYCIRVYSRALTADEIDHNHAIDNARFNLP